MSTELAPNADTLYIEADIKTGQSLVLPEAEERAVYVANGKIEIEGVTVSEYTMAVLTKRKDIVVTAIEDSRIALVGGEPLGKRYIEWNFVSSRKERIEKAKEDWQADRFPKVLGDEKEFIPSPN